LKAQHDDWTAYGKDADGGHYSEAIEITRENVKDLKKAWTHRSEDFHDGNNWTQDVAPNSAMQTSFQATPLLVNETLYYCTPYNRVFALNSETGEELAKFRLPTGGHATPITYKNKGGRQFVVIAAGGHWALGSPASDHLIAFALPKATK
jgi:glucose dehydrogenase